jgi:hypothetical protein
MYKNAIILFIELYTIPIPHARLDAILTQAEESLP